MAYLLSGKHFHQFGKFVPETELVWTRYSLGLEDVTPLEKCSFRLKKFWTSILLSVTFATENCVVLVLTE